MLHACMSLRVESHASAGVRFWMQSAALKAAISYWVTLNPDPGLGRTFLGKVNHAVWANAVCAHRHILTLLYIIQMNAFHHRLCWEISETQLVPLPSAVLVFQMRADKYENIVCWMQCATPPALPLLSLATGSLSGLRHIPASKQLLVILLLSTEIYLSVSTICRSTSYIYSAATTSRSPHII